MNAPGTLFTNFLSLFGVGRLSARLVSAVDYDQVNVSNLQLSTTSNLSLELSFQPAVGTVFTLINNMGPLPTTGQFTWLPEGAILTVGTTPMMISYVGGTGNDVTLTVLSMALFMDGFE